MGIDPGGVSGWATYTAERMQRLGLTPAHEIEYEYYNEVWCCGQLDKKDHHYELDSLLGFQHVDDFMIVCESFDYRNLSKAGLEIISREYIGVMKRFCQERSVPYVLQTSSQGKVTKRSFVRKENLERLGLWVRGGASSWNHAMDAYGHILYYMINNGIQREALLRRGWK